MLVASVWLPVGLIDTRGATSRTPSRRADHPFIAPAQVIDRCRGSACARRRWVRAVMTILEVIIALFLPPLSVAMKKGLNKQS